MSIGWSQVTAILGLLGLLLTEASCANKIKVNTVTSEKSGSGQQPVLTYEAGAKIEMSDAESAAHPLLIIESSRVCSDITFYNGDGELVQGNRDCSSASGDPNLKPEYIKEGVTIGGVTGTVTAVSDVPEIRPENIKSGVTIAGVSGTLTIPADCSADGAMNCVATATYKAALTTGLAAKIAAGQTVAGESGTFGGGAFANCTSDGETGCVATATYRAALTTGLAAKVVSGNTVAGVPGSATAESHSNCSSGNQTGCVATASYKTMDVSLADGTTDLTAGNFNTTIATAANFEFWDSTGTRHVVAGDSDLAAANIANAVVIHGVTGTATVESHSDCTAANQSGCVATATYKTMNLTGSGTDAGLTAGNFNTTIVAAGNFEFWDASGTRHSVAGDTDLAAGNVLTGKNIFGVDGSVTASPANCSSNGSQSCVATGSYFAATSCAADSSNCYVPSYVVTTQPLKAISYDAINSGKASIRSSLTLSGIAGTLADCSGNAATGCVTTATYQSADLTNLAAGNIKRGVSIAGTTGDFPSAASPLPRYSDSGATTNTAGIDETDLTNFLTQLTSAGTFEFWDSSGIRRTGSGDADITAANVKNAVAFENLSVTGTYTGAASDCTGDGQTGCTTTATYKSVDTSALTVWDIRKGKSAGGIAGSLTFFKNMANTTLFDRTTGTGGAAGLDIYDTIDDYNNGGSFPTQNNTGWDQATGANWTQVVANTTYKDEITGLVWLKDDAATYTWENAITKCENSTAGSRSDWRLPTQKELMQAYTDGIWSQTALSLSTSLYWSASSQSFGPNAWFVYLFDGFTSTGVKSDPAFVVCVAP